MSYFFDFIVTLADFSFLLSVTVGILQYNPIQFQKSDQSDFLK